MKRRHFLGSLLLGGPLSGVYAGAAGGALGVAPFEADVTPPIEAGGITYRLYQRGLVGVNPTDKPLTAALPRPPLRSRH